MSIIKHSNVQYSGNIPLFIGDRRYGQDIVRDWWSTISHIGSALEGICGAANFSFKGGQVSQGSTVNFINITELFAIINTSVEFPGSFATIPPDKISQNISIPVNLEAQTDFSLSGATLDGSTTNYVKASYGFTGGNTRERAKATGTYSYEGQPTAVITVDSIFPLSTELQLATLVGNGTDTLTITNSNDADDFHQRISDVETNVNQGVKTTDRPEFAYGLNTSNLPDQNQNVIFNAIAPTIPNTNDVCLLSGTATIPPQGAAFLSYATRINASTIRLRVMTLQFDTNGIAGTSITDLDYTNTASTHPFVGRITFSVGPRLV